MQPSTASLGVVLLLVGAPQALGQYFDLPPLPPPDAYGDVVIDRPSSAKGVAPVVFSHLVHRQKFTCRVCHSELDFATTVNTTEITEKATQEGAYCGACHNGTVAFGHGQENCRKCHVNARDRKSATAPKTLPRTKFGNRVDWMAALASGAIKPASSLGGDYRPMTFDKTLSLEAEWDNIPPAVFPHDAHNAWLDCSSCHPGVFNIEKKTTKHFSMPRILKGEFCGACHLRVAFPLNDCRRCHPKMRE